MADSVEILFRFVNQGSAELDKAAESAKKVEDGARKAGAATDKLEASFKKTGDASKVFEGLGGKIKGALTDPLGAAGEASDGFLSKFGKTGAVAAAVAAGAALAGQKLFSLVAAQGAAAEATLNLADRLGLTAGQVERLQAQAGIAGVNVGALEGAARTLSLALEDSAGGGAKAAAGLRGLGVATREMNGELRGAGAVLLDTLEKLSRIESDSERVFRALQVLPKGAALELLPLIKNYGDLRAAVESLGVGVEDGLTKKLADADDAIGRVELAWNRLKRTLAGGIVGSVTIAVSNFIADAVGGGRPAIKVDPNNPNSLRDQVTNFRNGAPSGDFLGGLRAFADGRARDAAAAVFRASESNTTDGQKAKLLELDRKIADLVATLSESIDGAARTAKAAELVKARAEKAAVEAAIKSGQLDPKRNDIRLSDLFAKGGDRKPGLPPSLLGPLGALGVFRAEGFSSGEDVGSGGLIPFSFDRAKGDPAAEKAFADALLAAEKLRADLAERRSKVELDAALRLIELGDNEFENARRVRDLKIATAKDTVEARQAELDFALKIEEIEKRRREKAKDTAGKVFDSINSREGGFGLGDFLKGQKDILLRQVFVNGTASVFEGLSGIGGKIGRGLGPFGKLFEGTFLDPKNADSVTDKNTTATDRNTAATERLTAVMGSGGAGGGFIPGVGRLSDFISDGNGITGQGGSSGLGGLLSRIPGLNKTNGVTNFFDGLFRTSGGKGVGAALGVGAGAFQIIGGIQSGSAGGVASGILSAASAIPGPQQPFLQAGALIAGLFGGLFGNSRQKFDREQTELLNSRRFSEPVSGSRSVELLGGGDVSTDFDFRGRTRIVVQRTVNVKIDALDARSIEERGFDLSQAVAKQVDAGMPISESINRAVFGAGVA